ncbi:MAG: OmpA family protein [Bacteroidetes bacterium]|jgi:outer membrane protein OmpA-like peptidoglycan-associated protein/tetratricopeptide (TPR) repeat protein|nr:OmpA family protein [Bacteroidota bacterium]
MKNRALIVLFLLVSFAFKSVEAQSPRLLKQAEKRYNKNDFTGAISVWKKAFDRSAESDARLELAYKIGEAYVQMNQLPKSVPWLIDATSGNETPVEWFILKASVHLKLNQLDQAESTVRQALKKQPYSRQLVDLLALIKRWEAQKSTPDFPFEPAHQLNSPWSDYAALWQDDRMLVSSARPINQRDKQDNRTSEYFSAVFECSINAFGDFEVLIPLNIRPNKNIGTLVFDHEHKRVFFTQCRNRIRKCALMMADYDAESNSFGKAKRADFTQKKIHYGHPFIREDGRMLYFVSDLPGGYGGKDIYRISLRDDGGFGVALNMGPKVNSGADELFPTSIGDSILLFSVERFTGYGGLDIFASQLFDESASRPVLLGYPFNSQSDDFYLNLKKNTVQGFLSSNREVENNDDLFYFEAFPLRILLKGEVREDNSEKLLVDVAVSVSGAGSEELTFLTDSTGSYQTSVPVGSKLLVTAEKAGYFTEKRVLQIADTAQVAVRQDFRLSLLSYPAAISGIVSDRETKKPMPLEKVVVSGPGGFLLETYTDLQGLYRFDSLKPNHIYTVKVSKQGYFNESRVCRIPDAKKPQLLNKQNGVDMDFELTPIQEKKEVLINNIYYDFDKASLRESSKIELNKLVSMLRETPQVIVQINAHTDARGSNSYNDKLSEERAASVVNYLVRHGIDPARLVFRGFGKRNLVIANATTENEHQTNRRTTFTVTGTDFKPFVSQAPESQKVTDLVYRIQLMASSTYYSPEDYFAVLKTIIPGIRFQATESNGLYRYEAGDRYTLSDAESLKNQIVAAGFSDCFIVPYHAGIRISMQLAKTLDK